jgi:hypothetical protein
LTREQKDALWTNLGDADAEKAYNALCALIGAPAQAVPLVNDRLRPAPSKESLGLRRLIADLDNDSFIVRQNAEQALAKLGVRAEGALREAVKENPTLQARKSMEALLEKVEGHVNAPERLREMRAVEALEHIGTPEAQKVLEKVATGAPEARLTQEAKASLERLANRPVAVP